MKRVDPKTFKQPAGSTPPRPGLPPIGNAKLAPKLKPASSKSAAKGKSTPSLPTNINASVPGAAPQTLSFFKVYSYNYYGASDLPGRYRLRYARRDRW